MNFSKLYKVKEMNSFQIIAITGFVMTLLAHLILAFLGKQVESFGALYVCWLLFFVVGSILNYRSKPGDDHHHHH